MRDDFTRDEDGARHMAALIGRDEDFGGDRPTRAELEADDFDDWRWAREQGAALGPDPWCDPVPPPREYPPMPTDPPF